MGELLGGSGQRLRRIDERMRHGDTSRRGRGSMLYPAEGEGSTGPGSAPVKMFANETRPAWTNLGAGNSTYGAAVCTPATGAMDLRGHKVAT